MQDHFLKLGLDPGAPSADIEAAIKANPEQAAAAEILLNEHRRVAYQRTVSTLRSIGILRHRLDLDKDNTWFVESCPDFAPRLHTRKFAAQPTTVADATTDNAAAGLTNPAGDTRVTSARTEKPAQSRTWLKPLLAASAIAAILVLLIFIL